MTPTPEALAFFIEKWKWFLNDGTEYHAAFAMEATLALTEQAQEIERRWWAIVQHDVAVARAVEREKSHADCHPAALCDGSWPELERRVWEAAAVLLREQTPQDGPDGQFAEIEQFGQHVASLFDARAAAQETK